MAFESVSVPATYKLTGSKQLPGDPSSIPLPGATPDGALRIARDFLPAAVPLWIVMPEENTSSYVVKMRFPEDHSSNGASIVWVD
jgi:hypothetical protein